jgi:hypothetical protein
MGRQVTVFMPIVRVSPAHKHTDDTAFGGAKPSHSYPAFAAV